MSAPEVASWAPDRLDAFVLGTDHALYHKWWDGGLGTVGHRLRVPRRGLHEPAAAGHLGPGPAGRVRPRHRPRAVPQVVGRSTWGPSVTGYEYLGGICMSPPEVVAWGTDRLDVFVLGTDNAVYHKWWDGDRGRGPGSSTSAASALPRPRVVAWGQNRLDLFVIGTDSALYHKWYDGSSWSADWEYLGGVCTTAPTVVSWGADRLDVFVLGTDSALYHKWWDGSADLVTGSSTWAASAPTSRGSSRGAEPARRVRHRHRQRAVPQVVGRLGLGTVDHRVRSRSAASSATSR